MRTRFTKMYPDMYDGTIMAAGWHTMITFQQMLMLADSEGIVDMTPLAISTRTGIPLEIIKEGIGKLEEPDPESRRPEEGGRRIVRLHDHRSWGWRIVNFVHYRNLTAAEDKREYDRLRWKERSKSGDSTPKVESTGVPVKKSGDSTTSHTNTKTNTKKKSTTLSADADAAGAEGTPPETKPFDVWWLAWPVNERKRAREKCRVKWKAMKLDDKADEVMAGLERWKASEEWTKEGGRFVPMPMTWLNRRGWEDEVSSAPAAAERPYF